MKIMALVLFVFSVATITSCSKSNDKLILGNWKFESVTADFGGQSYPMSIDDLAAMFDLAAILGEEEVDDIILEFKNDGKVYFEGEGVNYTVDGDQLTIFAEEMLFRLKIVELSGSKMTLEGVEAVGEMEIGYTLDFKKV